MPTDVDRALAFAILCALFATAYPRNWRWVLVAAVLAPCAIEMLQMLSPTRHPRLDDAVVKALGGLAGVAIALFLQLFSRRFASKNVIVRPVQFTHIPIAPSMMALPVKSRLIQSMHFSQTDGRLRIRLSDGRERLFEGVTAGEALAFVASPSPGTYYMNDFKKRFKRAA